MDRTPQKTKPHVQLVFPPVDTDANFSASDARDCFFKLEKEYKKIEKNVAKVYLEYKCSSGIIVAVKKGSGSTNLFNHVKSTHLDWKMTMVEWRQGAKSVTLPSIAITDMDVNTYKTMKWAIEDNLPFNFHEKANTKAFTNFDGVCSKTLIKACHLTTQCVERQLAPTHPSSESCLMGGQHQNEHYIARFAVYMSDGVPEQAMLSMAPLLVSDEDIIDDNLTVAQVAHGAQQHTDYLASMLDYYHRGIDSVSFLVGDNCSVIRKMARDLQIPLIGCASHRLNLAVKMLIETKYNTVVEKVHTLMVSLKSLNNAVALRRLAWQKRLQPKLRNVTRWSSTYAMLKRYMELKPLLRSMPPAVIILLPTHTEEMLLEEAMAVFAKIDSVTTILQFRSTSMNDVRALFDGLMALHPQMEVNLSPRAHVVENPDFENAVVKLQRGDVLSARDKAALQRFKLTSRVAPLEQDDQASFAQQILKKARAEKKSESYDDILMWLPPTSNAVERFFSTATLVLSPLRQNITPMTLEATLFLKLNRKFWNLQVVAKALMSDGEL